MGRSVANPPDEAAGKTGHTPSHRASPRYMGAKGLIYCFKNGSRPRKPRENKHFARFLKQSLSNYPRTGCNPRKIQDLRAFSDSY